MSDRCDLSDLPVEQCACRIHGPKPEAPEQRHVLARIEAQYPSTCQACGERFPAGERIALDMTLGWLHEGCAS